MNRKFKKIDLNDPATFQNISENDKVIWESCGEDIEALVIHKDNISFRAAYRAKSVLSGNMINIHFHYSLNQRVQNFRKYNYSEKDPRTSNNYQEFNEKLNLVGI